MSTIMRCNFTNTRLALIACGEGSRDILEFELYLRTFGFCAISDKRSLVIINSAYFDLTVARIGLQTEKVCSLSNKAMHSFIHGVK